MNTLLAGPWAGEFGWELFAWQAYIRSLSKNFDKTIIISRNNSRALYKDFADLFIPFEPEGGLADSFFMHNFDFKTNLLKIIQENKIELNKNINLFLPRRIGFPPHTHYEQLMIFGEFLVKPEYICFGEKNQDGYDFIFHMRNRDLRKEDNWSLENWKELKSLLGNKKIACIGTRKESLHLEGTDDLRDLKLDSLMTILRNSKCAFGPSSGPMHLASLCNLPHIVWSNNSNKLRYEENWNPLQTKVLFSSNFNWHPSAKYVYEKFKGWDIDV